ncbi:MAG TPA: NADH-quinone oxidoreductase subunit J [Gemmatimonadales bacterium]|jgi:NADH-quinone oxidoreductase subunit J|nr:NADH-quinone oxidoreductase subunit J [Gemmatimonadales bacterium]
MSAETVFYVLGGFAVLSALLCIVQRNPVASALWLVSTMFALAAIYVLLNAQFIAAIQVLVYAGAVMVLFLFVIMLLNLGRDSGDLRGRPARLAAVAIALGLLAELVLLSRVTPGSLSVLGGVPAGAASPMAAFPAGSAGLAAPASQGVVGAIAGPLFQTYLVPFEITSVLLLAAAVGAVVLAKRKL